jgi:hypothetical protein
MSPTTTRGDDILSMVGSISAREGGTEDILGLFDDGMKRL